MNYIVNYVMQENLFANVEYSPVKHAVSRFSVRKNVTKEEEEEEKKKKKKKKKKKRE